MKNKKSLLSLGLLALVLVLGVGYAVVSNVGLTFGGTATVADHELAVDIASVTDTKTNATVEHSINATTDAHDAADTFTITGMTLGETVKMTYTIDNHETDVDATISDKVALTNSNTEYFDARYTITDGTAEKNGGTATVEVVVSMKKTPVTSAQGSATIRFELEGSANDNAGA